MAVAMSVIIDLGADAWAIHGGTAFLAELAGVVFVSVLFGAFAWVFAFLTTWPLFLLTTSLAAALRTRSLIYFIVFGALAGALLSTALVVFLGEAMGQGSIGESVVRALPRTALYGASGGCLFWWKVGRHKSFA